MGSDYVLVWDDDVILIENCHSMRAAYKIGVSFVIKQERGALTDRYSLNPPATKMELKQARNYFKQNIKLLAINCYL